MNPPSIGEGTEDTARDVVPDAVALAKEMNLNGDIWKRKTALNCVPSPFPRSHPSTEMAPGCCPNGPRPLTVDRRGAPFFNFQPPKISKISNIESSRILQVLLITPPPCMQDVHNWQLATVLSGFYVPLQSLR